MADELDLVDALAQISFLVQGMLERRAAERDISLIQTRLLGILRDRRPTMNELAQLLDLDKSSVSGLVDRAQRRGLVVRIPSQVDRRSVRVRLTEEGRALVEEVPSAFAADVTAILGPLSTTERAELTSHLSRILVANAARHAVDLFATAGQRPATQRPATQRPAIQRPATQRPATQRPATQRQTPAQPSSARTRSA